MYGMMTLGRNFEVWVDPKFRDSDIESSGWDSIEDMAAAITDSIIWDWDVYFRDNDFYDLGLV